MPISDKTARIGRLIVQQFNGSLDDSERQELDEWLASSADNRKWYQQVTDNKFYLSRRLNEYEVAELIREEGWNKILATKKTRVFSISRRVAVAAAVLIVASIGTLYLLNRERKTNSLIDPVAQHNNNDVPPGGNKAVLTLGNGAQIVLNDAKNGALAQQGKVNVSKLDSGQITYNLSQNNNLPGKPEVLWNTLATPRGGQYKVVLADGSKVWLNAASSLRFPSSFSGKTRQVILTGGEAYFEVAKNEKMPFNVKINDLNVMVLGTSFNINAYSDENSIKTTLINGSVKVSAGLNTVIIKPGQQVTYSFSCDRNKIENILLVASEVDAQEAASWKNGLISFKNEDTKGIMRKISRWYDVDVSYRGDMPIRTFMGGIPRNSSLSEILKILALNHIHTEVKGRGIIVTP